jgi:hypothetical protein
MSNTEKVKITVDVDLEALAYMLSDSVEDNETLINFILDIELIVADYDFTVGLRNALDNLLNDFISE